MKERLAQQRVKHKQEMDVMSAFITKRFVVQMMAYGARFRSLEESTVVSSEPEVATAHRIDRSPTDSTQGNNLVNFLLSFNKTIV